MRVGLCSASGAGDQCDLRCHRAGLYTVAAGSLAAVDGEGGGEELGTDLRVISPSARVFTP
jgi:hypothetical protein